MRLWEQLVREIEADLNRRDFLAFLYETGRVNDWGLRDAEGRRLPDPPMVAPASEEAPSGPRRRGRWRRW
jgi:hypothetical protein